MPRNFGGVRACMSSTASCAAVYVLGFVCLSVCLSVIKFSKQGISKNNLCIFVKLIADTSYTSPCKLLTSDADHIQDGWLSANLVPITFYWLSTTATDEHLSECSSGCYFVGRMSARLLCTGYEARLGQKTFQPATSSSHVRQCVTKHSL